ncbi:MAG: AAA family ATPase [Clostridia bacterium]|nr:AAA family ATPase [Clostridia bacterium]
MRLISCYIVGFGKFVNVQLDLSNPVNILCGENGWGKTTVADFLESMLYGIDGSRSKAVTGNNRLKYEPWSGAKFGGALTFEYEGKTYRVERTFGKTPSADTVTVYDENRMQTYIFGDRAEGLGERVFGVDRESFRKTAYFPQGDLVAGAVTADLKEKLTALLSASKQDNGAQSAMEKLDKAERALRSKRKPGKGKLDEIDERIEYVRNQKADSANAVQALQVRQTDTVQKRARLAQVSSELSRMGAKLEEYARRNEWYANRTARREIESTLNGAENKMKSIQSFFADVNPQALNTDGLERGINEFYGLKDELDGMQAKAEELEGKVRERQTIKTKLDASLQTLDSYELLLDQQDRADKASDKADRKNAKFAKKRVSHAFWLLVLCLAVAFVGAIVMDSIQILGIILLAGGTFGVLYSLVQMFRYTQGKKRKKRVGFADAEMQERYERAQDEVAELESELKKFPEKIETEWQALTQEMETKKQRRAKLNEAIIAFLSNFRFEQQYDYRAALALLKERAEEYSACVKTAHGCMEKLKTLPADVGEDTDFSPADMQRLALDKQELEREKERLAGELGRTEAEMQALEKTAVRYGDYVAEEERLGLEKARLEKRLTAVRYAKEILLRARANMANKYLDPVEKRLRSYAQKLGLEELGKTLQLQADGLPIAEDLGTVRSAEYYSMGLQDLFGLCMRFALAECIFPQGGLLILDDPFVNLDDDKTGRAKALLGELATRYQIVYLTCKQERNL